MNRFRWLVLRGIALAMVLSAAVALGQEIDWYSIDGGGGISTAVDIQVVGVVGQGDTVRMRGGDLSLSGGYLPLPPPDETIFENGYE